MGGRRLGANGGGGARGGWKGSEASYHSNYGNTEYGLLSAQPEIELGATPMMERVRSIRHASGLRCKRLLHLAFIAPTRLPGSACLLATARWP